MSTGETLKCSRSEFMDTLKSCLTPRVYLHLYNVRKFLPLWISRKRVNDGRTILTCILLMCIYREF